MTELVANLQNLISFIFVLGLLIFVHELGHFVMAKVNNMHVYQFCLGLGPKIIKYKGKETTYAICAFPIGGMVDLREDENDLENVRSFSSKKPYQRLVVILAGAFMNFVLAYILIVGIIFSFGYPTNSNTLGDVAEGHPADLAGIMVGDTIVDVNGAVVEDWDDITTNIVESGNQTFSITVDRDGQRITLPVNGELYEDGKYKIGIAPVYEKNISKAIEYGTKEFLDSSTMIFDGFIQLITGKADMTQVAGPVGIYKQVGIVTQTKDFRNILYFAALLSVNLGIFNLLPVPFLDGGRAVFILYEMIFRKPVDKEKEAFVHFIGMVALLTLMVVLVFKDLRM